ALKGEAVCGKCGQGLRFHGLVSDVTTSDFRNIVAKSDVPVVVDFWASWCGPCKMYGPQFEEASRSMKNAVWLKVNTETEQQLAAELGIRGIPCTIIFSGGKEVRRESGAMSASQLSSLIPPS
ncbi:MAG: thioredoxin, partial [Bacteriovoracaceae bacterium]